MAISASKLMEQFAREHRLTPRQCRQVNDVAEYINSPEASEALNHRKGPMVILSASGMATGGRVLHHIKAFAPDRRNTLIFAGFQAEGTRGATIVNGAQEVKIYGEQVPIQAEVVHLHQLSAHADYSEILEFLSHFKRAPERTFITHGEPSAAVGLRERIKAGLGWSCECPDYLDSVELP
jgi:metallo-beta-lactamase family protein